MPKTKSRITTTDAEIDAAIARGRADSLPRVVDAHYDEANDAVAIRFDTGVRVAFPRGLLQGLADASKDQLNELVIAGPGTGLYWPQLDIGHYVPGLMDGVFGTRRWMQELGRRGGSMKTSAKSAAARTNGQKGGRPRNPPPRWQSPPPRSAST